MLGVCCFVIFVVCNGYVGPPHALGWRLARPTRRVNWRKVAECNVDSVARRGDVHTLLSFADDVAHGDVRAVESDEAHPAATKAFALAQLTTQ